MSLRPLLEIAARDEHVDQVTDRGQFAVRGGILDVFGATEERAARLELFGDEIDQVRWFSTFSQRSLGEAEEVELSPATELAPKYREAAERALEGGEDRPELADILPLERFGAFLDLVPEGTAIAVTEEIQTALRDHWEDVTTAMHDADARRLYVDVAGPLAERAAISVSTSDSGQRLSFRAQAPSSAARSIAEAEAQLEREIRSGYRVVVAFEHRGEAERARYNLRRLDASLLD